MCLIFDRSGGERGADINTLRGSHGPDFEGCATITRADGVGLSCSCFGKDDANREKIILIKGAYCFVFTDEDDPAPKYAIALAHMKPKLQSPSHGIHYLTIETSLGDVDWELGFQQKQIAQQFADVFRQQAALGEADQVRKVSYCIGGFHSTLHPTLLFFFSIGPKSQHYSWFRLFIPFPDYTFDTNHIAPWPRQTIK